MRRMMWTTVLASLLVLATAGGIGGQLEQDGKRGKVDSERTTEAPTSVTGWVFFSFEPPEADVGKVRQSHATVGRPSKRGTRPTWQVPLVTVRSNLWALPDPILDACDISCVTLVISDGKTTRLSCFKKQSWSRVAVNRLSSEDTEREDIELTPGSVVHRQFWVVADATGSEFSPAKGELVQFLMPDGWRIGSSGWLPMTSIGQHEYAALVGIYQASDGKPGDDVLELRVRTVGENGSVRGEATLPITCVDHVISTP